MPDKTGETRRARNKRFGQAHTTPPDVKIKSSVSHLLKWFWQLNGARTIGFNGPNPISYTDIKDWAALTGTIIRREETLILRSMDDAYLKAISDEIATEEKSKKTKAASKTGKG